MIIDALNINSHKSNTLGSPKGILLQQGSARGSFAAWARAQPQVPPVPPVPPALVLVLPLVEVAVAALQTPLEAKVADSLTDIMRLDALRCASTFLAL